MRRSSLRKAGVFTACGVWICWAVWTQFLTMPNGEVENHSSLSVKERMSDCAGNFQQRYDCKNSIVIETDRMTFLNMVGRIVIVVLPPLLLIGAVNLQSRRRDNDDSADDDEWADSSSYRRRYHRRSKSRHD
ncbi:hypothetical protein [Magnetospirillum molischianum]|uniref:Uncharacterized protein n=1 Tax=Magnetospirillum molischianum DSM 120 TaxID=1150626 RepID=H8FTF0_MAGML|nr:hypothetical protein [Magnetospirillum molischianum]CCG41638.1 conserved exported hypothetical protein [Magnetospirillum molischianum DSM 120]